MKYSISVPANCNDTRMWGKWKAGAGGGCNMCQSGLNREVA